MAPHHQWAYTTEKGTHWWDGKTEDFAPLYKWITTHRELLDGFEPVSDVVLVFNSPAEYRGRGKSAEVAACLAAHNIQYRVAIAGGDWVHEALDKSALLAAQKVVVTSRECIDARQNAALSVAEQAGKLIAWQGSASCDDKLPQSVEVEGASNVWALVRRNAKTGAVAVHLLNRNYDLAQDATVPTGPLTVTLQNGLLASKTFRSATVHAVPEAQVASVPITTTAQHLTLHVPSVNLWSIVLLKP